MGNCTEKKVKGLLEFIVGELDKERKQTIEGIDFKEIKIKIPTSLIDVIEEYLMEQK